LTLEDRIGVLRAVPDFAELSGPALAAMAAAMSLERFRAGETIIGSGDPADRIFVLAVGTAEVRPGADRSRPIGRGTLVGEIAFLIGGQRTATVAAASDCEVLSLPFANYRELLLAHPSGAIAVATRLARLLVAAEARLGVPGRDGRPPT
jgi:CRP-like cAMP-binding protein